MNTLTPVHDKLKELGLHLPSITTPGGSYQSVNVRGNIAYVAIQFPILNEEFRFQGRLGAEFGVDEGYQAMALCALNVLAQLHGKVGFDRLEGMNHMDAYYQAAPGWDEGPKVVNGASELFVNVLGERGRHARAIFGVESLPRNFSVGITTSFTLLDVQG
ncbi:MAG: RidA family protein [Bacteroidota bacterium]